MLNQREKNRRTTMIAIAVVGLCLMLWGTCTPSHAQCSDAPEHWPCPHQPVFPIDGECHDVPVSPTEAQSDTATTLNTSGPRADGGQAYAGQGLGGVSTPDCLTNGDGSAAIRQADSGEGKQSRNPFSSDWLEVEYQFDSRDGESNRILSIEGHKRASDRVDVYGSLDLLNGVDDDLARFTLRAGVFGRFDSPAGLAFWYEDFTGSENERGLLGFYYDALRGGDRPFVRLVALPVATHDGGVMARVMFDVALHERWTLAGFLEGTWGGEDGSYDAAEPELRYLLTKGIWATLEYRRDERWGDEAESLALGLRAAL